MITLNQFMVLDKIVNHEFHEAKGRAIIEEQVWAISYDETDIPKSKFTGIVATCLRDGLIRYIHAQDPVNNAMCITEKGYNEWEFFKMPLGDRFPHIRDYVNGL